MTRMAPLAPFSPYRTAAQRTNGSGEKSRMGRNAVVTRPLTCAAPIEMPRRIVARIAGSMCRREGLHLDHLVPPANQMRKTGPIVRLGSALATYQCAQYIQ